MQVEARTLGQNSHAVRVGKGVSVALWTAQVLLAVLFIFSGVMKLVMPIAAMAKQSSLPGPFLQFIGVAELLGGIGLILPALLRIQPQLTPIAACGLTIIMAGAAVITFPMGLFALFPLCVGLISAFIAYGRFRLMPIQPRS